MDYRGRGGRRRLEVEQRRGDWDWDWDWDQGLQETVEMLLYGKVAERLNICVDCGSHSTGQLHASDRWQLGLSFLYLRK